jgi:arsenite-transporting ATPase
VKPPLAARYVFYGGKGGVGKTTLAAASALAQAESGRSVLVVSTDPAHSLGDAFALPLGRVPSRISTRRGRLHGVELDADAALLRWLRPRTSRLATIAERGTYLDREDVERFLGLTLPGVDELVGLLELKRLADADEYDVVVVDTAPTGHTLRLVEMPESLERLGHVLEEMHAKHRYLASHIRGAYRPDAADALIAEIQAEAKALRVLLRDAARATFSWVLLPEVAAVEESADGLRELRHAEISVREVVVNRVTPPPPGPCALCDGRRRAEAFALREARRRLGRHPFVLVPGFEAEPQGLPALRLVARSLGGNAVRTAPSSSRPARIRPLRSRPGGPGPVWLDAVARPGTRLVVFGGKGGVGKTTCAAATALALARRDPGLRLLLLSSDPAHSLGDVLGMRMSDEECPVSRALPGLRARELDADRALGGLRARYAESVERLFAGLARSSVDLSYDRAVVHDLLDLAPPGIDELIALLAVSEALQPPAGGRPPHDLVVLDTAPTGHALRLLALPETALEWVRALLDVLLKYREAIGLGELAQELVGLSRRLRALLALLHDPAATGFVAVTRPARLPRLETARLLGELRRRRLAVSTVLVNALTPRGCARCRSTARVERREVRSLERAGRTRGARGCTMVFTPLVAPPPRGALEIEEWSTKWRLDDA